MSNLTTIPLEDGFNTTLSQEWAGGLGTVSVNNTPSFTFPSGVTTYIVVNPTQGNIQIAEIDSYNATNKTLNVTNITLEKGASVNSTAQIHAINSKVLISDNYQFWADIHTAINSKVDADDGLGVIYATPTTRDTALPSPTNGMQVYITSLGLFTDYIGGAWTNRATGSTPNASETVSGKLEIATDAEVLAGTSTGGTGARLGLATSNTTTTAVLNKLPVLDSNGFVIPFINSESDGGATETVKGLVTKATDAEVTTGTEDTKFITSKQAKDNYAPTIDSIVSTRSIAAASATITYNHSLGKIPIMIQANAIMTYDGSSVVSSSYGSWLPGNVNKSAYGGNNSVTGTTSTTDAIVFFNGTTDNQSGIIDNVTSTTFDITWIKVGTGTNAIAGLHFILH